MLLRFPSLTPSNTLHSLALVLAGLAGYLDAVGYLTLHHVFVAHMTGNASKLGVALAHGHLTAAAALALAPLVFVAAVAAGTALLDARAAYLVLAGEAALVAAFMSYGSTVIRHGTIPRGTGSAFYVLLAVAVAALGFQTAALTSIDGETVRTTYVSGMLTRLGQSLVRCTGRRAFLASIWICYAGGATGGAAALRGLSLWCLAIPLAVLLAATVLAASRVSA